MTIKIPVSADFQAGDVQKQIAQINAQFKSMGDAIAKANNQRFEPITLKTKEDLKYFVQQSEKLLKIQGELRNRMERSGQAGKNPLLASWGNLYLNEATRQKRQREMLVYFGGEFEDTTRSDAPKRPPHAPVPPANPPGRRPPGGGGGGGSGRNPWVQQGARVLQSGLNAAGPVGGVAAQSLGTGMSAGFGAGLAGLAGGLAALGVGKLIGAIADKVADAQTEAIMNDQLVRRLGGGVGYLSLRSGVRDVAFQTGLSFNEAQPLAAQLGKLGNLGSDRAGQLPGELLSAVGFARGFGLDPSQGVGLFGQMRGLNVTRSDQDSRKMGLLIGEAIAKSDAFAKADEVMEAISGFVTSQTRGALVSPNLSAYTGELSALAGAKIAGLDVGGSAALLGRVNASLMAGGAHGEASQFFSSMVASRMGLDPIQASIMREGGAFATNDLMFGAGSAAARFGIKGPTGDKTFLQSTLDLIRQRYSSPGFQAMATANHLGIGMNQAMALLSIKPAEMGSLQGRLGRLGVDMAGLNSSGIADVARIGTADAAGLNKIAGEFLSRSGTGALNGAEADRLRNAMAAGDTTKLKDLLTVLAAQKGQAETEGSKTRDTISGVGNIMQDYAGKSLPLLNDSRAALLYLAGRQGGGGPNSLRMNALNVEHDENVSAIKAKFEKQFQQEGDRLQQARLDGDPMDPSSMERSRIAQEQSNARYDDLVRQRDAELAGEDTRYKRAQETERQESIRRYQASVDTQQRAVGEGPIDHAAVERIESGGNPFAVSSKGALGRMQTMPGTLADPGFGVMPARDDSDAERERVGHQYLDAMMARYGNVDKAIAAYNAGPGRIDSLVSQYGPDWLGHAPAETQEYVRKYHRTAATIPERRAAQLPIDEAGSRQAARQDFGPLTGEINVNLAMGADLRRLIDPQPMLKATVSAAKPFGTQ